MNLLILTALVQSTTAAAPAADWQLLFRDPPQGAVYLDRGSVRTRGSERTIVARFEFSEPGPDEVSELLATLSIDCAAGTYRAMTASAYDASGAQLYDHSFRLDRHPSTPGPDGKMRRVIAAICR